MAPRKTSRPFFFRPSAKTSPFFGGWLFLAIAYAAFFLIILVFAYTGKLPGFIQRIPYYDKIGHVVLYALASYLGHHLLRFLRVRIGGVVLPFWPSAFALFTLAEELMQLTSPNRTFSWLDLAASLLGVIIGYLLAERSTTRLSS
ncbi:MAG: hypothetical protein SW833_06635 [Cyanobacteriota bacterium]|nr:hypothetical protein [Cyanobacteriota bacterium]